MKRIRLTSLFIAATFSLGLLSTPVMAERITEEHSTSLRLAENQIGPKQAAKRAQQQYGGRVLSVKLRNADSESAYYAVKLIKNGKVSIVNIPAN